MKSQRVFSSEKILDTFELIAQYLGQELSDFTTDHYLNDCDNADLKKIFWMGLSYIEQNLGQESVL